MKSRKERWTEAGDCPLALLALAFACLPGSCAVGRERPVPAIASTFTRMEANARPDGVWVEWETGWEADNLGFHIWRESGGERLRITEDMIAGSALRDGADPQGSGVRSCSFRDPEGTAWSRYWIEDADLSGKRTMHGPLVPEVRAEAGPPVPSRLLSELGRGADHRLGRARGRTAGASATRVSAPAATRGKTGPVAASVEFRTQWALAAAGAVRLRVKEEGWYRLDQAQLIAAGLDPFVNPRNLHLYADGREEPLLVSGPYDRRLDPEDAIEFYGFGADTPWTDTRSYWLIEGTTPGRRVPGVRYRGPGAESPASFPFAVERKDRTIYFAALRNGEAENFFGPIISRAPVEQVLSIERLDRSSNEQAVLEVLLQGVTLALHRVAVLLGEVEVGEVVFGGAGAATGRFPIPAADLGDSGIVVTLFAREGEMDVTLVDSIRLTYPRRYEADGAMLRSTAIGGQWLTIRGFSIPSIRVADVTDPARPWIVRGDVLADGGGYAIRFKVPRSGTRELLAFTDEALRAPASIETHAPSTLHSEENGADLLVIGSAPHRDALAPLVEWREAQGLSVAWIDLEGIYDEFGFGEKSAPAIREFLRRAHEAWLRPPQYVLLAGDATFDPRGWLGTGAPDIVPAALVDTSFLETASDDWFVDFDRDDLPDLSIGRLPIRSAEEAAAAVQRIIAYETAPAGPWTERVIFVSDLADAFGFPGASRELESVVPGDRMVVEVFRGIQSRGDLLANWNEGAVLVNYLGHGSVEIWNGGLFSSADARALANGARLPVVVSMTCLNGFFHDLYSESLAEALMRADAGGAVAVWASSGLTGPEEQVRMDREFLRMILADPGLTLGEAVREAKREALHPDVRRTWILFGDPAMRLR